MNHKKHFGCKKLIFGIAFLLLGFGTLGSTFAYWALNVSGASNNNSNNITVGVGDEVATSLDISSISNNSGKSLVPYGYANGDPTKTEAYDFTISINWNSDQALASGTKGYLTINDYKFETPASKASGLDINRAFSLNFYQDFLPNGHINWDPAYYDITADNKAPVIIFAHLALYEADITPEIYKAIAGQALTFTANFKVSLEKPAI